MRIFDTLLCHSVVGTSCALRYGQNPRHREAQFVHHLSPGRSWDLAKKSPTVSGRGNTRPKGEMVARPIMADGGSLHAVFPKPLERVFFVFSLLKISGRRSSASILLPLSSSKRNANAGLQSRCPPAICRRYARVVPAALATRSPSSVPKVSRNSLAFMAVIFSMSLSARQGEALACCIFTCQRDTGHISGWTQSK